MKSSGFKRKMLKIAIALVGFVSLNCDTEGNLEPQVAFIKYYGGEGDQAAVDIHVNNDGTIILLGTTITNGQSNIYLVKTDYNGNTLQTAVYGNGTEVARDLESTLDGNFVVLSRFKSQGIDSVKLLKITPDLVKIDSVVDGFPGKDAYPNTVTAVDQSGVQNFIVTGSTTYALEAKPAIRTAMLLRFDVNLDYYNGSWDRLYSTAIENPGISDIGVRTVSLDDNRFYVFGYSNGISLSNYDVWYYGIDNVGNSSGNNSIPSTTEDFLSEASISSNLAFGTIATAASAGTKELVFSRYPIFDRVENEGALRKELGDPINTRLLIDNTLMGLEAVKIVTASLGGYYVVANQMELDNSRNIWVSRIDEAGNVLWSSSFGAKENDDRAGGVAELPNGRVVVLGTMNLENQDKLALINLSSNGRLTN